MSKMNDIIGHVTTLATSVYSSNTISEPIITGRLFRLHYPFTVFLLSISVVLGSIQIFGKPIQCHVDSSVDEKLMNTYCWIHSTYTIPNRDAGDIEEVFAAPGVGPHTSINEETKYHKYYQWVVFFLIFQGLLFYFPYYIWNVYENGRIKMLLIEDSKKKLDEKQMNGVIKFFKRNSSDSNNYFYVYIFCEILNLINVILQLILTDALLGYEFTTYGINVLNFAGKDDPTRIDPMDYVFPKVSKCTFRRYGPSGNIINFDGLCVLSLNILYEKMFVFLWFWMFLVLIVSVFSVSWQIATLCSYKIKTWLLRSKTLNFNRHPDSDTTKYPIPRLPSYNNPKFGAIKVIMDNLSNGNWFILHQLSSNMLPHNYKELIRNLAIQYGWQEPKPQN